MTTLYTLGYLHSSAERTIAECITLKIPLVDIRYSPTSSNSRYDQASLQARKGIIYFHVPELGNKRYKENINRTFREPIVEIANLARGLDDLKAIMDEHGKAAIFCACSSVEHCHRKIVAQEAHNLFGWQIVHLPVRKRTKCM